jgi:hypothetical protein
MMLAMVIVAVLILSSALAVWFLYYRHWSASELADKMVEDDYGMEMGFEPGLAGKSVVVEGRVTEVVLYNTTLGPANVVTLDNESLVSLVYWDTVSPHIGDRVEKRITFEWAYWNDEKHVVSPQVWITFGLAFGFVTVMNSVSSVASDNSEVRLHNDGDNTVIEIDWLKEPVPMDRANCTLASGSRSGYRDYFSWSGNEAADSIKNLSLGNSTNHMIEFLDMNHDGYLDNGDMFVLKNLTRPDAECGIKTYTFNISWPRDPDEMQDDSVHGIWCYIPYLKGGAFWPTSWESPVLRGSIERADGVRTLRIDYVDRGILWQNMTILLFDGFNWTRWEGASIQYMGYLGIQKLGLLDVQAYINHSAEDGTVTPGDYVNVGVVDFGSFPSTCNYTLTLVYDSHQILSKTIGVNDSPVTRLERCAPAASGPIAGASFAFTTVHVGVNSTYRSVDLPWDYVFVNLTDGTNSYGWTTSSASLDLGKGSGRCFAEGALGTLAVQLCVYDLNGDGHVNRGDRLELRTPDASGFDPSTAYTVTARYIYGGAEICSAEFAG